jgi:hypothetical protein
MVLSEKESSGSDKVASTQELVANDVTNSATAAQARMNVAMMKRRCVVAMLITETLDVTLHDEFREQPTHIRIW